MKAAFDTNILVYAGGVNDVARQMTCLSLLQAGAAQRGVIPVQVLAEFYRVMTRKYGWTSLDTTTRLGRFSRAYEIAPTTSDCLIDAAALADRHGLQIFDAVILSSAAIAGCRVLFSEDMQHEAVFNGVTIVNPFADEKHPMLLATLKR